MSNVNTMYKFSLTILVEDRANYDICILKTVP